MSRESLTITICFLLTACSLPGTQATPEPHAWIDMPLPNTVLFPPDPCQVVAHGASPNGIALFELSINGTIAASLPNLEKQNTLATLNFNCSLQQSGKNILRLRVQDTTGAWSDYTETTVILAVDDVESAVPTATATIPPRPTETAVPTFTAIPTFTPTLIPTFTPTIQSLGSVSVEQISPYLVYLGSLNCGPIEVFFTARAFAPDGITAVVLFYRFRTNDTLTEFQSLAMNPVGGDLFEVTLNPTFVLGGSIPFDQAALEYQIVIQETDGDTSLRTPVMSDISVQACGDVAAACSSYTDERTCIANGCNWVSIPGIVPVYECRNP